jgi:hypothetical protein
VPLHQPSRSSSSATSALRAHGTATQSPETTVDKCLQLCRRHKNREARTLHPRHLSLMSRLVAATTRMYQCMASKSVRDWTFTLMSATTCHRRVTPARGISLHCPCRRTVAGTERASGYKGVVLCAQLCGHQAGAAPRRECRIRISKSGLQDENGIVKPLRLHLLIPFFAAKLYRPGLNTVSSRELLDSTPSHDNTKPTSQGESILTGQY